MQQRQLGRSDLFITPLALGGNVFGWTADKAMSFRLLDAFVAAGGNLVDTADGYPHWAPGCVGGESETLIGEWLRASGKRQQVVLATKVGKWKRAPGLSAANIRAAVDGSLRRLGVDVIDLYQAHADDPDTPLAETLEAFAGLIAAGKVRAIGASNYSAPRLAEALDVAEAAGLPRYESMQPQYNLVQRGDYEHGKQALAVQRQVGVLGYFSLAAGFLAGKYRSPADLAGRARAGMVEGYMDARGLRVLAAVDEVAQRHGGTPVQVSLAWLMARPGVTAPIASATSPAQLADLMAALELRLDEADMAQLDAAGAAA